MKETIIKCKNCGFKYYEGDIHVCGGKRVEEKTTPTLEGVGVPTASVGKEKKVATKTKKESFKIWKDS